MSKKVKSYLKTHVTLCNRTSIDIKVIFTAFSRARRKVLGRDKNIHICGTVNNTLEMA